MNPTVAIANYVISILESAESISGGPSGAFELETQPIINDIRNGDYLDAQDALGFVGGDAYEAINPIGKKFDDISVDVLPEEFREFAQSQLGNPDEECEKIYCPKARAALALVERELNP